MLEIIPTIINTMPETIPIIINTTLVIIEQSFLNFPIVFGAYCSVSLMKVPDLSLESAYVFGAITGTQCLFAFNHLPGPLTFIIVVLGAMCGGMVVGLISSTLTYKAKLPHLLSSILTAGVFHGVNQYVLKTTNVAIRRYHNILGYLSFLMRRNPEFPVLVIFFCIVAIGGYLFFRTQAGQALVVYGNNPKFFSYYGISSGYVFMLGILVSNACAGFSGFCDATSGGFVDTGMGVAKALFCITSLILGKTFVRPSKPFSIFVPIVGVISYFIIQQLLLKVGFNLRFFTMVQSLIVLMLLVTVYNKRGGRIDHLGV